MTQTLSEVHAKCIRLIGKEYILPITKNKGLVGHFLEDLCDLPHTPKCLDCSDGEVKVFPVKKLKRGQLAPKETIAITMLSRDELRTHDFHISKCFIKMNRMLVVPYFRNKDTIVFMTPTLIDMNCEEFAEMKRELETDYHEIQRHYIETDILTSSTGKYLQNRTKGSGHGSTSRAFYLRPAFMQKYVHLIL